MITQKKQPFFWSVKDVVVDKLCVSPEIEKIRYDSIEGQLTKEQLKIFHKADAAIVNTTATIIQQCYKVGREKAKGLADNLMFAAVNGRQGIIENDKTRPVETFGDAVKFINDHLPYL